MTTIQIVGAIIFLFSGTLLLRDYKNCNIILSSSLSILYVLGITIGLILLIFYGNLTTKNTHNILRLIIN